MIAYKMSYTDNGKRWMFAGTTIDDVANCLKSELEMNGDGDALELGPIQIESYETTQAEIDELPEFEGW